MQVYHQRMSKSRDQTYLVTEQYKTADNLRARIALHERFSTFKQDFSRWVFDHISAPEGARVLELGTGPANFWDKNRDRIPSSWHITLTDLSPGMIEEAKATTQDIDASFHYRVADAQAIPFADNSFDLVIANHMLYHVLDLDKGVTEIRRVLRPGGKLYAATNGPEHMRELDDFVRDLTTEYLPGVTLEPMSELSFRLDNGATYLERQFDNVELVNVPNNALEVTEAEPFMAYALSMNRLQYQLDGVGEAELDAVIAKAHDKLEAMLERGPIHVTKATGLLIAS